MREMKDSGVKWIGEIPEDWKISKVKYHVENLDGKRVPIDSALRVNGIYPYWGAGSITDYVDDYLFDEELILLGEDGAPFFDPYRPVAFLVNEKIWVNNHIHVLRPKSSINALFVTYFLNIVDYGTYINGTILNKLTQSNLKKIAIVYPSLEKQEKIVHYLDDKCSRIDFIISKQKQIVEKIKTYKQNVISEVVRGNRYNCKLAQSRYFWIGSIPSHWKTGQLKFFASIRSGITLGKKYESSDKLIEMPYLRVANVQGEYVDLSDIATIAVLPEEVEKYSLHTGELLMTEGGDRDKLGRGCVWNGEIEPCLHQNHVFAVSTDSEKLDVHYLDYVTTSDIARTYFDYTAKKTTNLASTNSTAIMQFRIPVPPISEQREIVAQLDILCEKLNHSISRREKIINELNDYKKSIIYECVTGKKEVPVHPDDFSNTGIKPAVLGQIRNHAKSWGIHKVILFGSRARGTFHRDSDIDLAVSGGNIDFFRLAVEEETDTLLAYDVVNLDRTSNEELLDVIRKEGVIIYEEV